MDVTKLIVVIFMAIAVYGGLHYYLYRKLRTLLPTHRKGLAGTLGVLAGSLFVVEVLIHNEVAAFVAPLAWPTFFWMGLVVLFFGISVPLDLLAWLARTASVTRLVRPLSSPMRTVAVSILVCVLGANGVFSAHQINIEQVNIESTKINLPLRIVQISDLHVDAFSDEQHIQALVEKVNQLDADVIVSTGDLIDVSVDGADAVIARLVKLKAKLGKYAVYGNHETFVGLDKSRILTERAGFTLLSNAGVTLDNMVNIFGVDDPSVAGRMQPAASHPHEPIPTFSNGYFTVLLKHQPVVALDRVSTFDLQLSGHVHGGQIYPFGLITAAVYRVPMGLSQIAIQTWLYVSPGAGTWGPPMRVLAPPEITLFDLRPTTTAKP